MDVRYPYIIIAACSIVGVIVEIFVPETLNQRLPESLEEAKVFGKGQPFFGLPKSNISHEKARKAFGEGTELHERLNQPQYAP